MTGLVKITDPSVAFALTQVLSILYLSDVPVRLVKWRSSDDPRISAMKIPPPAALYDKAVYTNKGLKKLSRSGLPWKATSASIRALISLAECLKVSGFKLSPVAFADELKAIAALQLQYCLDFMPGGICEISDIAAVLEAGSGFLMVCGNGPADIAKNPKPSLDALYERIISDCSIQSRSTMELAWISRGIAAWDLYKQRSDNDLVLSEIVLEIISRKSISGLFSRHSSNTASAPLGQQFFILDAITAAYPFVRLEVVKNRITEIFGRLVNIAYRETPGMFAFWRKEASLSAFDAGAFFSCLDRISGYIDDPDNKEVISRFRHTAVDLLIKPYVNRYRTSILKGIKWYSIMRNSYDSRIYYRKALCPVFPKRFSVGHDCRLELSCRRMVRTSDLMYLSASLLRSECCNMHKR
ncbi:MAG TPA: hypothetical protein PK830_01595 [Candidatus Atribacteria bacterium]|nr:hypothetical protein [Candidatus Atribacteria bacterium]HPT77785.1 hypothetical protein [Candidatus Atribacteria bacterium]